MPYYPDSENKDKGIAYKTEFYWEHAVADYIKCSLFDVLEMDIFDFYFLRREAFIIQMSKTEQGREYLEKAKLFESTEPDLEGLKALGGGRYGRKS